MPKKIWPLAQGCHVRIKRSLAHENCVIASRKLFGKINVRA